MKKLKNVHIVGIIAFIFVVSVLNTEEETGNTNNKSSANQTQNKKSASYAKRAADNSWPTINEGEAIQVENLTNKNYYLVLDGSGSMGESNCSNGKTKIDVAKSAVSTFINKIPDSANLGLVVFDGRGTYERTKLSKNSKDNAIEQVSQTSVGGGTPLRSSIDHAYKSLTAQAVKQLGYGEYHLVVVTDGAASDGEDPRDIVQDLLTNSPIVLHTVGFCIKGGHTLNQAGNTFYKSANNPEQLATGLESVLAEAPDFKVETFEGQMQ